VRATWVMVGAIAALVFAGEAAADPVAASAVLDGGSFIQSGSITNDSDGGLNIVTVIYSLGVPADGIATWENFSEAPSGFVRSDVLSDGVHYQTISWSGLNVTPGNSFNFSGLDIDLIVALSPLNVTSLTLGGPSSLANAFVTVVFDNGATASAPLVQQDWRQTQNLELTGAKPVPEPAMALLALVGAAGVCLRRRGAARRT